MTYKFSKFTMLAGLALSPLAVMAGGGITPHQAFDSNNATGVQFHTQVRIDVDKDTDSIIIKQDDNIPALVTKAFVINNADVYEIRPYILAAVTGTHVSDVTKAVAASDYGVRVECAKYDDGKGVLIVSALEDRFGPQPNGGLSITQLVEKLDQPGLTSHTGLKPLVYFPESSDAFDVSEMLEQLFIRGSQKVHGTNYLLNQTDASGGKIAELLNGHEKVSYDKDLNAVYVETTPNNLERVKAFMDDFAGSTNPSFVMCDITLFEVNINNELDFGNDFLAWKAASPTSIFELAEAAGSYKITGAIDSQYVSFLASKGYAKAIKSYTLHCYDDKQAIVKRYKPFTYVTDSSTAAVAASTATSTVQIWGTTDGIAGNGGGNDVLLASGLLANTTLSGNYDFDNDGDSNEYVIANAGTGDLYTIVTAGATTAATDAAVTYTEATKNVGLEITIDTNKYGKSSSLQFNIKSSGIESFSDTGTPVDWVSEIETTVAFAKSAKTFAIGGIEEKIVTTEIDKVPFLGSIPILGSLFSREQNVVKSRRLVAVCNVKRMKGSFDTSDKVKQAVEDADALIAKEKAGDVRTTLNPFNDQYMMDDQKSFTESMDKAKESIQEDTDAFLNR